MKEYRFDKIMEEIADKKECVIIGAGKKGTEMLTLLSERGKKVVAFYDNDKEKHGKKLNGIEIHAPIKRNEDCVYIICLNNKFNASNVYEQLVMLGIEEDHIFVRQYSNNNYKKRDLTDANKCKEAIDELYYEAFCKKMNWEKPSTYNEKLNWEKVYDCDPIKTKLADKYLVRNWVAEKIGEEYLTKLYGVWDTPEEIDYRGLPSSFVLKTNNGSARNIIVPDKSKMDEVAITKQFLEWKEKSHYYIGLETQYRDIVPKIICEEYLEGVAENLYDYDVFCFHGEPKYIWCIKGSHRPGCKASFYDLNWNKQEFSYGYPIDEGMAPKPDKLDEMLELSRKLSQGFKHARVDWYEYPKSRHGILFSEITFTTWAGLKHFFPPQYDEILGKLI